MANDDFEVGDEVRWNWGSGTAHGTIGEKFTERVTRTIKGEEVVREATDGEPAYLLEQDDGDEVLKSGSEIEPA